MISGVNRLGAANLELNRPNRLGTEDVLELVAFWACRDEAGKLEAVKRIKQLNEVSWDVIIRWKQIIDNYDSRNGPEQLQEQLKALLYPLPPPILKYKITSSAIKQPWDQLLPEILYHIFCHCNPWSMHTLQSVCKNWEYSFECIKNDLSQNSPKWQELLHYHFSSTIPVGIEGFQKAYQTLYYNFLKGMCTHREIDAISYSNSFAVQDGTIFSGSSGYPGKIEVWNEQLPNKVDFIATNEGVVRCIAIKGQQLFSGHDNGKITIWNLKHCTLIQTLEGLNKPLTQLIVKNGKLYSIGNVIDVWELKDFKLITTLNVHKSTINAVAIGNNILYSASSGETTIKVWDLRDSRLITTISAHESAVNALTLDEDKLYSSSEKKGPVKVWDVEDPFNISSWAILPFEEGRQIIIETGRLFLCLSRQIQVLDSNTYASIATFPSCAAQTQSSYGKTNGKLYFLASDRAIEVFDFTASYHQILDEIAEQFEGFDADGLDEESILEELPLLKRLEKMPTHIQEAIFQEIGDILYLEFREDDHYEYGEEQFEGDYPMAAEGDYYEGGGEQFEGDYPMAAEGDYYEGGGEQFESEGNYLKTAKDAFYKATPFQKARAIQNYLRRQQP